MTLTTHAVAGAVVIGFFPEHLALGFLAAFASHFLLDAIPHWDYPIRSGSINPDIGARLTFDRSLLYDMLAIGFDALLGITLSVIFFTQFHSTEVVLLGAIGGILPDPLQFIYTRFRREPLASLQRFHEWIHTTHRLKHDRIFGIFSQAVLLAGIIVIGQAF